MATAVPRGRSSRADMKLRLSPAQRSPSELTEHHWFPVIVRMSGRTVAIRRTAPMVTRIHALPAAPTESIIGTENASLS